ncbi:MAG: protein kinase [Rhodobacterales bacterium]|nr:protein kinase [Rhodobacterales bacterium]
MTQNIVGQTLGGRYTVVSHTSEEMLGRVYLARDTATGGLVSLKVLHPYLTENLEKVRRFAREITATSAVRHANSVAVVDSGESGELHWLVLEYLNSRTLQQEIASLGTLPIARVIHIGAQIASAMAAAHEEGIVHRNLNPGNVLLLNNTRDGDYVKVRDFGLSRLGGDDEGGHALTGTGARIGNTFYMAPEYIECSTVDPRGDVYALGGLFHCMITAHPPFQGRPGQVLEMHITEPAPSVTQARPDAPRWLAELVLQLLEKDINRRPQAADIHDALVKQAEGSLQPPQLLQLDGEGNVVPMTKVEKAVEKKFLIGGAVLGAAGLGLIALTALMAGVYLLAG